MKLKSLSTKIKFVFLFLFLILISCNKHEELINKSELILSEVNQKHKIDKRINIHTITIQIENEKVILLGETEHKNILNEITEKLKSENINFIDSVLIYNNKEINFNNLAFVNVSVANLRAEPKESAELSSQVLMGSQIKIIKNYKDWFYVQTSDKYLGWISDDSFIKFSESEFSQFQSSKKIIVTSIFDIIKSSTLSNSNSVSDITAGSILMYEKIVGNFFQIKFFDGRIGYLSTQSAMDLKKWDKIKKNNVEQTAKSLIGSPYLWGGTSTKGMDCSGFTKIVFLLNGFNLSRDANQQALQGVEIKTDSNFSNFNTGDLLFFGNLKKDRITHVGIYLDSGNVIHASGMVKINNLHENSNNYSKRLNKTFITARRVLNN